VHKGEAALLVTITELVADAVDAPIKELPPLRETVDPEALTALLAHDGTDDVTVTFTYAGRDVLVSSNGTVSVQPPDVPGADQPELTRSNRR